MKLSNRKPALPKLDAPGPSPWYLCGKSIETSVGRYGWCEFEKDSKLAGMTSLCNPAGACVLLLDFHWYVQQMAEDCLPMWYEKAQTDRDPYTIPSITFQILKMDKLEPLNDSVQIAKAMRQEGRSVHCKSQPSASYQYMTSVEPGSHRLENVPADLSQLGEVLVLANCRCAIDNSDAPSEMCRAIFDFNFREASLSVYPQDWFNRGGYDFGYQWITRVAREAGSGQIIGEGIRLGFFRLDKTNRNIEEWLVKDPFYGRE